MWSHVCQKIIGTHFFTIKSSLTLTYYKCVHVSVIPKPKDIRFIGLLAMSSKNWFGSVKGYSLLNQMTSRNLSTSSGIYASCKLDTGSSNVYFFSLLDRMSIQLLSLGNTVIYSIHKKGRWYFELKICLWLGLEHHKDHLILGLFMANKLSFFHGRRKNDTAKSWMVQDQLIWREWILSISIFLWPWKNESLLLKCNTPYEYQSYKQSDILWHQTKIYVPKVFLLIKIKPEHSDILYNPMQFPGSLEYQITQVPLYMQW